MGYLRLLLSTGVLLHHTHLAREPVAYASISAFFVLSGYLIALTLTQNHRGRVLRFYWFRFLRIYPLYWTTLIFVMVLMPGFVFSRISENFPSIDPVILWAGIIALWNEYSVIANPPAWTLSYELMFYIVAPLLVGGRWVSIAAVVAICLAGMAYAGSFVPVIEPFKLTTPDNEQRIFAAFLLFALGMAMQYIKKSRIIGSTSAVWSALGALAIFIPLERNNLYPFLVLLAFLSVTILVIMAENHNRQSAMARLAGDLCYPVYLIHFPVVILLGDPMWLRLTAAWGAKPAIIIVSIVVLGVTLALSIGWLWVERQCVLPLRALPLLKSAVP